MALSDTELAILDLERRKPGVQGAKERHMRELGLSPTRYYQLLAQLLDKPEALLTDPRTVRRLQRLALERQIARRRRRVMP